MDEKMGNTSVVGGGDARVLASKGWLIFLIGALVAGAVYLGCSVSPPSLMDDVDAAVAQISRNMVTSGDWVTPRVDGIVFLENRRCFTGRWLSPSRFLGFMTGRHASHSHFRQSDWPA